MDIQGYIILHLHYYSLLLAELLFSNCDWFHFLCFWCVIPDLAISRPLIVIHCRGLSPWHLRCFVLQASWEDSLHFLSKSEAAGGFGNLKPMILTISHHHYPWRVDWWPHVHIHKWRCPGPGLTTWKQTLSSSYIARGPATFPIVGHFKFHDLNLSIIYTRLYVFWFHMYAYMFSFTCVYIYNVINHDEFPNGDRSYMFNFVHMWEVG